MRFLRKTLQLRLKRFYHTNQDKPEFFITTPIFYVNAAPHIGHLHSTVLADAIHRFKYLMGITSSIFSTGTDEHGLKVQKAARNASSLLPDYCENISSKYSSLFELCDISNNRFIRTTNDDHQEAVSLFWHSLTESNAVYKGTYHGWYCEADESFLTDTQLRTEIRDGQEIRVSAESGRSVHWVEEENYMFRLSQYRDDVLHWLMSEKTVQPKKFNKILTLWISEGAMHEDVSVSRPSSRVFWGIEVPGNKSQTIYVWLDALVSYLTAAGYPHLTSWPPSIQVIGKDILKFHGIYWPAFLIACGLEPPERLLVHSHWTVNNEKMSKSSGNVICPFEAIDKFTATGLRYFLLREATLSTDSNYSETKVRRILNSELADTLGNLLSRCTGHSLNLKQEYPALDRETFDIISRDTGLPLVNALEVLQDEVTDYYGEANFYKGIAVIVSALREANKFFEISRPWDLKKQPNQERYLSCVLHLTMEALRICGIALQPIIPELCERLLNKLAVPHQSRFWKDMTPSWKTDIREAKWLTQDKVVLYQKLLSA